MSRRAPTAYDHAGARRPDGQRRRRPAAADRCRRRRRRHGVRRSTARPPACARRPRTAVAGAADLHRRGVVPDDRRPRGGKIVGFGNAAHRDRAAPTTGTSTWTPQGRVVFGVYAGAPARPRHQPGALQRRPVAPRRRHAGPGRHGALRRRRAGRSRTDATTGQSLQRLLADRRRQRPGSGAGTSPASIDEVAVYPTRADGRPGRRPLRRRDAPAQPANLAPTAAFTSSVDVPGRGASTVRVSATPTARSPATPGTSVTARPAPGRPASHTYAAAGTYTVHADGDRRRRRDRHRRPRTSRSPRRRRTRRRRRRSRRRPTS